MGISITVRYAAEIVTIMNIIWDISAIYVRVMPVIMWHITDKWIMMETIVVLLGILGIHIVNIQLVVHCRLVVLI